MFSRKRVLSVIELIGGPASRICSGVLSVSIAPTVLLVRAQTLSIGQPTILVPARPTTASRVLECEKTRSLRRFDNFALWLIYADLKGRNSTSAPAHAA